LLKSQFYVNEFIIKQEYRIKSQVMKKFSIITVCRNEAVGIEKTILSVINQTFKNYDYIVLDGGSTDGTLDIISRYNDKIDILIKDESGGVYKAMNKGISLATGEYLIFMNGGDAFADNEILASVASETGNADIMYGLSLIHISEPTRPY